MKNTIVIFFYYLTIAIAMISCESPNGNRKFVADHPLIDFSTQINVDTLFVELHANYRNLINGYFDLGDGNILIFNNLHETFDTSFTHVYKELGSYDLIARFGDLDTTASLTENIIIVQKYFTFDIKVGMKWKYKYYSSFEDIFNNQNNIHNGIHEWEIKSFYFEGDKKIFNALNHMVDTVKYTTKGDSTKIGSFTTTFKIFVTANEINFKLPYGSSQNSNIIIPINYVVTTYPVKISANYSNDPDIWCENLKGITKYYGNYWWKTATRTETLNLIQVFIPK